MDIHITDNPTGDIAAAIQKTILKHSGNTLCLCSGGSALQIFSKFSDKNIKGRTIFMMGDERVSREADTNNYLQLLAQLDQTAGDCNIVDTTPEEDETLGKFALRMNEILKKIISEKNLQIISILGIGQDGHTAGIFPLSKERFQEAYRDDSMYLPVVVKGLTIDSRASVSPQFILNHVDRIFGFVVGSDKKQILEKLKNENLPIHEMPAQLIKQHSNAAIYTDQSI